MCKVSNFTTSENVNIFIIDLLDVECQIILKQYILFQELPEFTDAVKALATDTRDGSRILCRRGR